MERFILWVLVLIKMYTILKYENFQAKKSLSIALQIVDRGNNVLCCVAKFRMLE